MSETKERSSAAIEQHTREWSSGRAYGWCEAKAEDLHTAEKLGGHICIADLREQIVRQADRAEWLELLRKACRKRGVEI